MRLLKLYTTSENCIMSQLNFQYLNTLLAQFNRIIPVEYVHSIVAILTLPKEDRSRKNSSTQLSLPQCDTKSVLRRVTNNRFSDIFKTVTHITVLFLHYCRKLEPFRTQSFYVRTGDFVVLSNHFQDHRLVFGKKG